MPYYNLGSLESIEPDVQLENRDISLLLVNKQLNHMNVKILRLCWEKLHYLHKSSLHSRKIPLSFAFITNLDRRLAHMRNDVVLLVIFRDRSFSKMAERQ